VVATPGAAAEPVLVRVLGPVTVVGPGGPAPLSGARQRAVVGLLALAGGTVLPQWRLVDAMWGERPPRTALRSLHSHVARVRQALEACGLPGALVTREPGYALVLDPHQVDAHRFEADLRRGRTELAGGDPARAAESFRAALALWHHDTALADAEPTGWGAAEADRLAEARLAALEDLCDAELRLGHPDVATAELSRLLVAHPLRERAVGLLMLAWYRGDRPAEALDAYQRLRARLADTLGTDPGPELVRLNARILRQDPDLREARPTATSSPYRPAQLPAPAGHFTGREAELTALDRLLTEKARIAVISGPAGMGKTTLAVQWAHRVADRFPDGQLFVDLRGHDRETAMTPGEALAHLLRSLGVAPDRIPATQAEQAGLYRSLLYDRRLLLVLDDGGAVTDLLPLVPAGAGNLLLVTSRHSAAGLAAHHAVQPVGLDPLGDHDALALVASVLGADRVAREPDAAAELVVLCGGMPLALRIAAAKLAGQPHRRLADLAGELAGAGRLDALAVEGDSRSVRTVLASAYRSLSPPAASVFRRLGLHPGPTVTVQLAAAAAACPLDEARSAVQELTATHLLTGSGPDRYRFHDLIGLFARQSAHRDEPPAAREAAVERIVDWYLASVEAANRIVDPGRDRVTPSPRHRPPEPPFPAERHAALSFLDDERANLLPVVRYAADHGHPLAAAQLTYLLAGFYDSRGVGPDRIEMCWRGVAAAERTGDPALEGLMRSGLGRAHIANHRFEEALDSLHRALPLMRAAGDRRGEGHIHNNLAAAYYGLRRFDEAAAAFQQALAVHTADGHRLGVALALNNLGQVYAETGQLALAGEHLSRALAISRELGNPRLEAGTLHSLGEADLIRGEAGAALHHFEQALRVNRTIGDRQSEARTLIAVGIARLRAGDPAPAAAALQEAATLSRTIAHPDLEASALGNLLAALVALGDLAPAREAAARALALRRLVPNGYEEAHLHRHLGELEARAGDPAAAQRHRDEAVRLYRKANATVEADELAARRVSPGQVGVRP
jgi:DNA-binding SARP family transcriptional activator/Flp pilus assembly protein TadD